jgi:hypothetical protein
MIFAAGTVLLVVSEATPTYTSFFNVSRLGVTITACALFLVLANTPRHTVTPELVLGLLAPLVVIVAWSKTPSLDTPLSSEMRSNVRVWMAPLLAILGCETFAILGSNIARNPIAFPTLSSLLDPLLNTPIGQTGFVISWLAAGWFLLAPRKGNDADTETDEVNP